MSSSDSNVRDDAWARHYRRASERRRARGWHRRDAARPRARRGSRRFWVYATAAAIFVALTVVALVVPR
ncbi:MAG TPA: hypothetical protein VHL80_15675 [Polyangia bacterium]|nr:hypothetical protein [Polyangia bacterium]